MKYIEKTIDNEPTSLKAYRSTPGVTYDGCNKNDIRKALLEEQGYICAYCNQRIKDDFDNKGKPFTTIEHYKAQSDKNTGEDLKLNYMNMLGVCRGNEGKGKQFLHCDKSRGNQNLFINPTNSNCEGFIKYQLDGTIYSDDDRVNNDLDNVLNLNTKRLVQGRRTAIDEVVRNVQRKYKKEKGQTWRRSDLNAEIRTWENRVKNKHHPFCQVAVFYLKKKLSRLT